MNQLVSLNNQAVECLWKGDAFEACNILMNMTTLYMQLSDQVQTLAGSQRYHQHVNVNIQWVPFPSTKEREVKSLIGTQRNVDCTDHQYPYQHQHQQDDDSTSLLSSSSSPFVILPYNHALVIRKTCCGSVRRQTNNKKGGGDKNRNHARCSETIVPEDLICMHCWDHYDVCPCTITPVMWYNLAITCQTLAFQQQQQQQQQQQPSSSSSMLLEQQDNMFYLKRSLYLYQQAMDIIGPGPTSFSGTTGGDSMGEDDEDTTNPDSSSTSKQQDFLEYYMNAALPRHCFIPTLRLAIWNNISSIYHTLGQLEYSTMGMQTLQLQLQRQQPLHYWGSTGSSGGGSGHYWFQEQQLQQRQQDGTRLFYENIASFFHMSRHGHNNNACVAGAA